MDIGIPKEDGDLELRVGLGTGTVGVLVGRGHRVYVQTGAGLGAGFSDEEYLKAGASIAYSAEELHLRAAMICRVRAPDAQALAHMQPGQILCCFAHLFTAGSAYVQQLRDARITVFGYELLQAIDGSRPVLRPMSVIAGRMLPQLAASLLQSPQGRGVLLSGIPGIPPGEVVILGAGEVGFNAARGFAGLGAQVTVMDTPARLAEMDQAFDRLGPIRLVYETAAQLARAVAFADVLIGSVLVGGERSPIIVTEEMVKTMRQWSVIIDVSIADGGCVATSRPTTPRDPTFIKHGVIHCCVPNLPSLVARTASRALGHSAAPYLARLAEAPTRAQEDPELRTALLLSAGEIVHPGLAATLSRRPRTGEIVR
ncbi:MAG: alanine dehydrogenase [Deltaproteobacteria bacterium]|nr:alanine dehydrogenase [Deltaproteobacteria bacterium]